MYTNNTSQKEIEKEFKIDEDENEYISTPQPMGGQIKEPQILHKDLKIIVDHKKMLVK